jgi:sugar O-acyltransferase (sialic acid O-acetyltransferase NeuD family)
MKKLAKLVMLGGGGHARALTDVIESFRDYSISLGGKIEIGATVSDTRSLSDDDWKHYSDTYSGFILGVGQVHTPAFRRRIVRNIVNANGMVVTLISPYARVSPRAKIGPGTVVMHHACLNNAAEVREYCIINTSSNIEHDAKIGSYSHISTGAVINGGCEIGSNCFIGSNAVVLNEITVCDNTLVGAGSVVTKDILEPGGIYVGNPAKFLRRIAT